MKVLLAPDKFKDALTAEQVCDALAAGVRLARPDAEIVSCPLADGGEGTGRLLARALAVEMQVATVLDPLGRERVAPWWHVPACTTAIVEMAEASGLALLGPRERNPLHTTSFGTGQLLRAALEADAERILLCVGGSATVDGGAGCLQALGWQLLDACGRILPTPLCGEMLPRIATIRAPPLAPTDRPARRAIEILCDVDNPLVGPRGAAAVFAPQKGASPAQVAQLAAALELWADVLRRDTGRTVHDQLGAGAAGGLPAALAAAEGAALVSGFARVAELLNLDAKLRDCDLCLTGEGRLDEQTPGGKVVAGVAQHARKARVPVAAFVGAVRAPSGTSVTTLAATLGLREIVVITPAGTPTKQALAQTAENLKEKVAEYFSG